VPAAEEELPLDLGILAALDDEIEPAADIETSVEEDAISLNLDSESNGLEDEVEINTSEADSELLELDAEDGDILELDDDSFDLDIDSVEDELPEENEMDTKLDLARAYIDMEDIDSASAILTEVLEDGDEEQKVQARELQEKVK